MALRGKALPGKVRNAIRPLLAVVLGLFVGILTTVATGEKPWHVFTVLVKGAFGTPYDFGMTLFYTTPLLFTGLSVAFAFRAGLFNIGAEGQLTMGALAAAATGLLLPNLPWPVAPVLAALAALVVGGFWGFIAGWLRARRGSHEVITTIMLNFIAAGLTNWATLYLFRTTDSQAAESRAVGANYLIHKFAFFQGAPVSSALILALIVAGVIWFFFTKVVRGFELKAAGENETSAEFSGIDSAKIKILGLTVAGAIAGLVGVAEVLGNSGRFKIDFSPGYGFIGIAVALLGRGHPLGVVASALLFGALQKGTSDLDLETATVTRDLSLILQAFVILSVSSEGLWDGFDRFLKRKERA